MSVQEDGLTFLNYTMAYVASPRGIAEGRRGTDPAAPSNHWKGCGARFLGAASRRTESMVLLMGTCIHHHSQPVSNSEHICTLAMVVLDVCPATVLSQ